MGSGALVLALSTDRCAFVPFSPGPAAVNAYPLSSLVPRRGLGLNLFRVGLNSIPCILRGFRPYIFLKVLFSSLGQFAATAGLWLPIKESCISISNLSSPCLRFPLFYSSYFGH